MPVINKQGEVTTVTVSPEAEKQMIEFEREMIKQNQPVRQHGATMLENPNEKSSKVKIETSSPVEIYRMMKRIAGVERIDILSSLSSTVGFEPHIAAASSTVEKSVINKQDNTNLVLRNLMKKICSMASPTSL
jgi:hypothetical protein